MKNGRQSLYLDFYPPIKNPDTGKPTRREFLGLFIYEKPKTEWDKEHNGSTIALAENLRAQRQISIQNAQYGFLSTKARNIDFVQYFHQQSRKRESGIKNYATWISAGKYLEKYTGGQIPLSEISTHWLESFKTFLLNSKAHARKTKLSQNSAHSYYNKVRAALREAFAEGLLPMDINRQVKGIKPPEVQREFLTLEELRALAAEEYPENPEMRRAALFSALTGLRFSDVTTLKWKQLQHTEEGFYIQYKQQKTKASELLPISDQAAEFCGVPGNPESKIFNLKYSAHLNYHLSRWVLRSGIKKPITWHSFRHTFATLQLYAGSDILTVSKMLGHKDLKTTTIYTKIVDQAKRDASNRIKL